MRQAGAAGSGGQFGTDVPLRRPGQPFELAPAYELLASDDSPYLSGQIPFVNGGTIAT